MQFYILFPFLVWLFKHTEGHHELLLIISAIIQFIFLLCIKYIFSGLDHSGWPYLLRHYGDNVLSYQYYFILGGYCWINYDKIKAWVRKYHWQIYITTILLAAGTIGLYLFNTRVLGLKRHLANIAHQPYIMIYATVVIFAVIAVSLKYAQVRVKPGWEWFSKAVSLTSTLSFGVYLVQIAPEYLLKRIIHPLAYLIPSWALLLLLPLGVLFVFLGCMLISYICYKVPPLGILIGKSNWNKFKAIFVKQ